MGNLNGLSSGQDCKLSYVDINGNQKFAILESFTAAGTHPIVKQISMDGTVRNPQFYQGWSGTFVYERTDSTIDNYINLSESNYYLGGDQKMAIITQTLTNPNGSISQFQYIDVAIELTDAGMFTGTDIVKQTLRFEASKRLTIL